MKYGITEEEIAKYGIVYSDSERRVILPVYDNGDLVITQSRKVFDDDTGPKYRTVKRRAGVFSAKCDTPIVVCNQCVITEDILSAIKCSRFIDSFALLGTTLSDSCLGKILKNQYDKCFIFLDDDNRQVKLDQIVLKNKLELYIDDVRIVKSGGRDPKEMSDLDLMKLLDCWYT